MYVSDIRKIIASYFPDNVSKNILHLCDKDLDAINEIRIRAEKPIMFITSRGDFSITPQGLKTYDYSDCLKIQSNELLQVLGLICNNSIYAHMDTLKNGFITLAGGHRVGITGKAVIEDNKIKNIKDISSINIRIAREIKGVANCIIKYVIKNKTDVYNTLIVSPPGYGKTTLLRDMLRILSDGCESLEFKGMKIAIIDERSEIASLTKGIPQNDIGIRSDVLDCYSKKDGIMLALRTMSPQIIATDEIGNIGDYEALQEVVNCGVRILTTAHGVDIEDIKKRRSTRNILQENIFERFILLGKNNQIGKIKDILDGNKLKSILSEGYKNVV